MMDAVYVCRSGENPELRYSLRTLEKNVDHGVVWIFGDAPAWVDRASVEVVRSQQKVTPYASTRAHIAKAINDPRVSDPFTLWTDDFYAMQSVDEVPLLNRGPLNTMLDEYRGPRTPWVRALRETMRLVKDLGVKDPLFYDLHVPIPVRKDAMEEALKIASRSREDAVHTRTIYGNLLKEDGVTIEDPKMHRRTDAFPTGPWLSSSDATFRSAIEPVLRYLFPDPCPYEKEFG